MPFGVYAGIILFYGNCVWLSVYIIYTYIIYVSPMSYTHERSWRYGIKPTHIHCTLKNVCVCVPKRYVCVYSSRSKSRLCFRSASLTRSSLNFLRQSLSVSWCFNVSRCLSASFCIFKDFYGSLVISLQAAKLALREIQYITAGILRMLQTTSDGLDHPERSIICFPPEGFINSEGSCQKNMECPWSNMRWVVHPNICLTPSGFSKGELALVSDTWYMIRNNYSKPKEKVKSWWDTC